VVQWEALSPYLFIIVLDYALRQATDGMEEELGLTITTKRFRRTPAVTLTDLDFADDVRLDQAQHFLDESRRNVKKMGLELNAKKTEVMTINTPAHES